MIFLAIALWPLGDVERAVSLVGAAQARIAALAHVQTRAFEKWHAALFELVRGDLARAAPNGVELGRLAREHDLPMWRALGVFLQGLATAESDAPSGGLEDMRRGVELLREQNVLIFDGLFKIALAVAEARAGDLGRAVVILDEALASSERTGHRAFDAELHRVRGEMLLRRDPADPAPAEEAFQTAIAIARAQKARSFGLRAGLALAMLYQSTARPAEAHAVLEPAVEGFAPTSDIPEIDQAQALLAALAEIGEVKNAAASRQRRLQLQTSYSQALMLSRGFGSEEAMAAFAHAQELAKAVDNAAERFDAYYGLFVGSVLRGELRLARETAEIFLREAEKEERMTEAAAARRCLGVACLFQGDLAAARAHFEQALRIFDPERDREAKFRFGHDTGAMATGHLAVTNWLLGEAGPAWKLVEEAIARAVESAHAPTLANAYWFKALFDAFRDDAEAAQRASESVLEVSRAHGLGLFLALGALSSSWACARLGDALTGMTELRQVLSGYADQGNKLFEPLFQGRLAELEAEDPSDVVPLARIDEALALAEQTGQR
jgi:predicted ATPase